MKGLLLAFLCCAAMACMAAPTLSPTPEPTASVIPTPSPNPSVAIECGLVEKVGPLTPGRTAQTDPLCPAEAAAAQAAVGHVGYPVSRLSIVPTFVSCWPFGTSPCLGSSVEIGAYVAFRGTDLVAAVTLQQPIRGSFTASVVALRVPPHGWAMP